MKRFVSILSVVVLWPLAASWPQVRPLNEAGVSMAQLHEIVRDMEASKKFWTLMGGTPIKVDGADVIKFPGVLIFLTLGKPSGGSSGTPVDHVGLLVADGVELVARMRAAGAKTDPDAGIRDPALMNVRHVYSPDDLKIEILDMPSVLRINPSLVENRHLNLKDPIAMDHLHYALPDPPAAQAWYAKMFGAIPATYMSRNGAGLGANLAGTRMNLGGSRNALVPTKGRSLDHIGFEVKNLEAFCKKLEASGVRFDAPYSKSRHKGFASAELTDPWGTSIELTEGLSRF